MIKFFDVDSYKISHHKQYPEGATHAMAYVEARGGDHVKFFGLQYILQQLEVPTKEQVEKVAEYARLHFGRDDIFNREGWLQLADLGYYPLRIRAVKEGGVYPTSVPLITIENTHPDFVWLVTWFETQILRVWYPTNVATISYDIRQTVMKFLEKNGTPETIGIKIHDFGSRGSSSSESAMIGGMSHLLNFQGTDTLAGWMGAIDWYDADPSSLAFSIAASEHSTITCWGRENEKEAYRNMIHQFGGEGNIYACVSDSYNIWHALNIWKELEGEILEKGGTLVIRPDSGDPVKTPVDVVMRLLQLFGYTYNEKGYKVLPDHIRVIQGDGVHKESIRQILHNLDMYGVSADNINFGMGGALLQRHDRDTFKFAYKVSAITIDGEDRDVYKDPVTDPGKKSKKGYITAVDHDGEVSYALRCEAGDTDIMSDVFVNGKLSTVKFSDIRE